MNTRSDKSLTNSHKRILRFIIAGGSAAVTEYVFFIILHSLQLRLILANSISFTGGLVVSFSLNKLWVFRSTNQAGNEFGRYCVLALINLCLSDIFIWLVTKQLGVTPLIAKLMAMVTIAVWNYFIFQKIIFVQKNA